MLALIALVALVILVKGAANVDGDTYRIRWIGWVLLGIGFAWLLLSMTVIVPTKNVGVVTAFGKPTGTIHNGIHLVAPWETVTDYDATIQTLSTSDMHVRMVNGTATANVNVTANWRLEGDIQQIHVDWRSFDRIERFVVLPRLQDALNKEFTDFDPLISLKASGGKAISMTEMETRVSHRLQAAMPAGVYIDHLQIPLVVYPPVVQEALNAYQKELANTQVALQQKITAQAQKDALDILSQVKMSPEAFLQQCLIMTERLAQQGKQISQTWSCVANTGGVVAVK